MRISKLQVSGFRGFPEDKTIDLNADVILLYGPNGTGKTSLMDAILWCICGRISRFKKEDNPVSKYSRDGIARVSLDLVSSDDEINITRKIDKSGDENLRLLHSKSVYLNREAETKIGELLFNAQDTNEPFSKASNLFTRSIYLQQDLMREFIETDKPSERFLLLSDLAGVGTILDLKKSLETGRAEWRKNLKRIQSDQLDPALLKLSKVVSRILELTAHKETSSDTRGTELKFKQAAIKLVPSLTSESSIEHMLLMLSKKRSAEARTLDYLIEVTNIARSIEEMDVGIPEQIVQLDTQIENAKASLLSTEKNIAEAVDQLTELYTGTSESERLSIMAATAAEHLEDSCPICDQKHEIEKTKAHLQQYLTDYLSLRARATKQDSELQEYRKLREANKSELVKLTDNRLQLKRIAEDLNKRQVSLKDRLSQIGLNPETTLDELNEMVLASHNFTREITDLISTGEKTSIAMIRAGEKEQISELEMQKKQYEQEVQAIEIEIGELGRTDQTVTKIIEELRMASLEIARSKIENIAPIFQRIYSRIDPHPTFKVTELVARKGRGTGAVDIKINDPNLDEKYDAGPILSSSQLNAFAVSLFLALNLSVPDNKLGITMLDDPLQNLDKINLLGLVDVLRRIKTNKQVIISTHDERFKGLLERKLRPVRETEGLRSLVFEDWTTSGPTIRSVSTDYMSEERVINFDSA